LLKLIEEQFVVDGHKDANIENVLSRIRALRSVAGKDKVRGLTACDLDKLDTKICQIICEIADKTLPVSNTAYHRIALWAEGTSRKKPIEVFTTNYDLLMEQALEDCQVPYFDGFAGSRKPFFDIRAMDEDDLPLRWARLWKLHGSINWYQDSIKGVFRGATNEKHMKRVIHPSHLKYEESRRMPYLAMMDRLRAFLRQPSAVIIICGYSFRDEHINEVIIQGLQGTQTAIAFALLFDDISKYPTALKLALKRKNLNLLARDAAVISGRNASWPEEEPDSITANTNPWFKWHPIDQKNTKSKQKCTLLLGDFSIFGTLLQELIGHTQQEKDIINGK
jgi:hypothetical protein